MSETEAITIHLKALTIHDANNTIMTVKECAEFLGCSERTIKRRIDSLNKHDRILATYQGGWRIPKYQFLKCVLDSWSYEVKEPKIKSKVKKVRKPRSKKTYLMKEGSTGFTKIGNSYKPTQREDTLLSQKPDIKLFAVYNSNIERELHIKFKDKRIRGEWFNLDNDDIKELMYNYNFKICK